MTGQRWVSLGRCSGSEMGAKQEDGYEEDRIENKAVEADKNEDRRKHAAEGQEGRMNRARIQANTHKTCQPPKISPSPVATLTFLVLYAIHYRPASRKRPPPDHRASSHILKSDRLWDH